MSLANNTLGWALYITLVLRSIHHETSSKVNVMTDDDDLIQCSWLLMISFKDLRIQIHSILDQGCQTSEEALVQLRLMHGEMVVRLTSLRLQTLFAIRVFFKATCVGQTVWCCWLEITSAQSNRLESCWLGLVWVRLCVPWLVQLSYHRWRWERYRRNRSGLRRACHWWNTCYWATSNDLCHSSASFCSIDQRNVLFPAPFLVLRIPADAWWAAGTWFNGISVNLVLSTNWRQRQTELSYLMFNASRRNLGVYGCVEKVLQVGGAVFPQRVASVDIPSVELTGVRYELHDYEEDAIASWNRRRQHSSWRRPSNLNGPMISGNRLSHSLNVWLPAVIMERGYSVTHLSVGNPSLPLPNSSSSSGILSSWNASARWAIG